MGHCTCWMISTSWMIFTSVIGIIFYLFDTGTDIVSGVMYIVRGDVNWGMATLIFVILPAIIYIFLLIAYSLPSCCCCADEPTVPRYSTTQRLLKIPYWVSTIEWLKPAGRTRCRRFMRFLLTLCRLEPVLSYAEHIQHVSRASKETIHETERRFFQKKQFQIFIETCMESLPQIALQLYILGRKSTINGLQVMSVLMSIISTWFIFLYIQVEREENHTSKREWIIKLVWCIFGIIPTLLGSFPAISLFSAVYGPRYLSLFLVLFTSFTVKWLFITPLRRYSKLSIRTAIFIVITVIKLGLLFLISLWYITVKVHERSNLLFANLEVERPQRSDLLLTNIAVEKPHTFIPSFIWPSTHPSLQNLVLKRESSEKLPLWALCNRNKMFRNGTFVTSTRAWLAHGELSENIFAFLKEDHLFCIYDIADFMFCAVFYCILLWILWDTFFYFIQCCVKVAEDRSLEDNSPDEEQHELQVIM